MSVRRFKFQVSDKYDHHVLANELVESELGKLARHTSERVLSLQHTDKSLAHLDFLTDWKNLEDLRIYACRFTDFSALSKCRKLKELFINGWRSKNPDLSFLDTLKTLRRFSLMHVPHLQAIPHIANCRKLQQLEISSCKRLTDIAAVTRLPALREFSAHGLGFDPQDYIPVMEMKTIRAVNVNFRTRKLENEFEQLLAERELVRYVER